jgi:hypothetical protein
MDREILIVFFYDVRCAVVIHFSAWSAVYEDGGEPPLKPITADMLQTVWNELDYRVDVCRFTKGAHIEHL